MTAASVTLAGRAAAEALMVDACTIGDPGPAAFNSTTGAYTAPVLAAVYTGPCRVQIRDGLQAEEPEVGERRATVQHAVISVPVAADGIKVDMVAEVTASVLDPDLVDRRFRVVAIHSKTHATVRRLQVEEITAGRST